MAYLRRVVEDDEPCTFVVPHMGDMLVRLSNKNEKVREISFHHVDLLIVDESNTRTFIEGKTISASILHMILLLKTARDRRAKTSHSLSEDPQRR